ncbi:RNA polymerase sigma factor RpoE [Candidatus Velamenicoccus archaeovorus]|uniref:RNA polymerase sigma factor n=1 Tax=Velamenicoccus archaeovorus TaxID=1930593 RepID=A0A410P612_VELA1|nr:sigma-70 family RNA polymerase sigma factor [Candidatus Velamenicoccus archaeovorus]QAT17600.1 RNA polymerase sigma factor RpoE [Candidatus Velamenicoccus archaeovorus]
MKEDAFYIEQFLGGEEKAFEAIVRKYQNRVLNIVFSLIGKDRESEDIAQEAFLKAYRGLKGFRRRCSFSTWLYRIVLNTTYDFLRKRRDVVTEEEALGQSVDARGGHNDVLFVLLMKERDVLIQKALGKVPLAYRSAVVLKDIEGLSYAEISKILSCRIGTVESRIYRARQLLKKELMKFGGDVI